MKVAIIGYGNIGKAVATGLIHSGAVKQDDLFVTRKTKNVDSNNSLKYVSNQEATIASDIIILAVKPHQTDEVMKEITPFLKKNQHQLVSLVTGYKLITLQAFCPGLPVYRAVPNTAASVVESITCIATKQTKGKNLDNIIALFSKIGRVEIIDEGLADAATVLGACGIAFALRFIRAASQGGTEIGFSADQALKITAQVVKGAADLILKTGSHPEQEIDKVATPRGITITGLNEMEHQGLSSALIKGLMASFNKINQMTSEK